MFLFRALFLLSLCLFAGPLRGQVFTVETVPDPKLNPSTHYVSNPSAILSWSAVMHIDSVLRRLEDSATAQVAVVVLPSIGEAVPKDFVHELFQKWGVGQAQKDNGLLLLFVLDQRRVEFETGYGLEGVLPDVTCGQIQRDEMVPAFRRGDYDGGMIAGVDAVADRLLHPDAVREIHTEITPADYDRADAAVLIVLAFLLGFCLACLRALRAIVRSFDPVKNEVDKVISKKKGHFVFGVLMYLGIPVGLALLLGWSNLYISLDEAFLGCYLYAGFLIWDSRARRMAVFTQLYGEKPEPQQYVRLRAFTRFYWFDALFYPLPFLWIWYANRKRLDTLRNHPRFSPDGHPLFQVAPAQKGNFLTPYQQVEERLKTVEYDVWVNEERHLAETIAYEPLVAGKYTRCKTCRSKAVGLEKEEVLQAATLQETGRSMRHYRCQACGAVTGEEVVLPVLKPPGSSSGGSGWRSSGGSGGSWGGSSSSSSSGSSWGGGRSGGGGAGSSW